MIYTYITDSVKRKGKLLALLIDPDKCSPPMLEQLVGILKQHPPHLLMVGGSLISSPVAPVIDYLKKELQQPVVLYPGSPTHLTPNVDAVLFLSMISGRNPELLIGHHVVAAPYIRQFGIEPISTGYMLIDGGSPTSVEYISQTRPIPAEKTDIAVATALAGEMLGLKMIYMDAGSGARNPISAKTIQAVKKALTIPLMIGGGITSVHQLTSAYEAGADLVVVGNVLEKDPSLIHDFLKAAERL
ncbi:geranylgeranylglyceryl/heptaprenylglyceryl phosphate synthase [Geofilum rubicundum]|uniref:Geranylgeranylglyceryl phosphate synthase n=1 Tax=Geofilum rubicundum JCM 15548 TaxID=1236989 RepID=A0A0E9LVG7_9BACT|nr:geranylgeranylglyceryl/heptaprenylglyceryl phosphate synthase [Geofilum rubicundum]GAO29111.1 homolog of geranylgeranylglyceryl phosphate synthase [Geofilum rubicundum JCM 15548]